MRSSLESLTKKPFIRITVFEKLDAKRELIRSKKSPTPLKYDAHTGPPQFGHELQLSPSQCGDCNPYKPNIQRSGRQHPFMHSGGGNLGALAASFALFLEAPTDAFTGASYWTELLGCLLHVYFGLFDLV